MVTYAKIRYTNLCDNVWVVCVYITWSIKVADVCVILVGDFTSWSLASVNQYQNLLVKEYQHKV